MASCKPIATPTGSRFTLSTHIGTSFSIPSLYHSIIKRHQYLTFTCPNFSYTVNIVCQYMHGTHDIHW